MHTHMYHAGTAITLIVTARRQDPLHGPVVEVRIFDHREEGHPEPTLIERHVVETAPLLRHFRVVLMVAIQVESPRAGDGRETGVRAFRQGREPFLHSSLSKAS